MSEHNRQYFNYTHSSASLWARVMLSTGINNMAALDMLKVFAKRDFPSIDPSEMQVVHYKSGKVGIEFVVSRLYDTIPDQYEKVDQFPESY